MARSSRSLIKMKGFASMLSDIGGRIQELIVFIIVIVMIVIRIIPLLPATELCNVGR